MAWPVTVEMLSRVESTGAAHRDLKRPKNDLLSANASPFFRAEPIGLTRQSGTSSGSTPRMFAAFTVCTFPGSSVRATTASASTFWPTWTSTVPASGSFRSRRRTVKRATLRPGV
jgi:hypothetical protein